MQKLNLYRWSPKAYKKSKSGSHSRESVPNSLALKYESDPSFIRLSWVFFFFFFVGKGLYTHCWLTRRRISEEEREGDRQIETDVDEDEADLNNCKFTRSHISCLNHQIINHFKII